jgi:hypothetical protein
MDKLLLKPKSGLAIPNPETSKDLPAWGAVVDNSVYWRRLLKDRDVVKTTEADIAAGAATEAKRLAEEEAAHAKALAAAQTDSVMAPPAPAAKPVTKSKE